MHARLSAEKEGQTDPEAHMRICIHIDNTPTQPHWYIAQATVVCLSVCLCVRVCVCVLKPGDGRLEAGAAAVGPRPEPEVGPTMCHVQADTAIERQQHAQVLCRLRAGMRDN